MDDEAWKRNHGGESSAIGHMVPKRGNVQNIIRNHCVFFNRMTTGNPYLGNECMGHRLPRLCTKVRVCVCETSHGPPEHLQKALVVYKFIHQGSINWIRVSLNLNRLLGVMHGSRTSKSYSLNF